MSDPNAHSSKFSVAHILEKGDGMAHYLVAALLLCLGVLILVVSTVKFASDVSTTVKEPTPIAVPERSHLDAPFDSAPKAEGPKDNFASSCLTYLSDILFGVIVLELLSTILTYIRAKKLESTIKDFVVVGLISCVRKILLTGAQSSIAGAKTGEFVQEAIGTVIMIIGICLLVGALLFLDRRPNAEKDEEFEH
jgi:uncharacterized membrane protein (DUF373 family)